LIFTKISGVSYIPLSAFHTMSVGEELFLRREPDNPYDRYAIGVYRRLIVDGVEELVKIGYIKRSNGLNVALSEALARGCEYDVRVSDLTGDWVCITKDFFSPSSEREFGVNISIQLKRGGEE